MKKPLLLASCLFCFLLSDAQVFKKGNFLVSGSYGLVGQFLYDPNYCPMGEPITLQARTNNVHLKTEYALSKHLGVGLGVNNTNFVSKKSIQNSTFTESTRSNSIIARVNFHILHAKKWDPYFGIGGGIGRRVASSTSDAFQELNFKRHTNVLVPDFSIGCRRQVWQKLSVFTEIGHASSSLQIGISYQL
jgi:hypothetical protein